MSAMKENGLSENTYKRRVTQSWTEKSGTTAHTWTNYKRTISLTEPQDHDSRRNKNFTYNQSYPNRSVKS